MSRSAYIQELKDLAIAHAEKARKAENKAAHLRGAVEQALVNLAEVSKLPPYSPAAKMILRNTVDVLSAPLGQKP
jgi:hypothetical protein